MDGEASGMKRCLTVAFAVALLATSSPPGRAEVPTGGPIVSPGVEVLTTIPDVAAVGGTIVEQGGRRYLLTTGGGGVRAYDVTVPAGPQLVSYLPLPHYENEDVEVSDELLLIAVDPGFTTSALGGLHIIDISALPELSFAYENLATGHRFRTGFYRGSHTVSCIRPDCSLAYGTGGGGYGEHIFLLNLTDPADPYVQAILDSPVGGVHDATVQEDGLAWVVGDRGMAALDTTDPARPFMEVRAPLDDLGYVHNMTRRGDVLMITEEDFLRPGCRSQGVFTTARLAPGAFTPTPLDTWTPRLGSGDTATSVPSAGDGDAAAAAVCSAHWFDESDDLVAIAWYNQGLRLLDVSDPADIREVGWFVGPGAEAFDALWATDEILYVHDQTRGLDVLRVDRSALGPAAPPAPSTMVAAAGPRVPHPSFGYACSIRV